MAVLFSLIVSNRVFYFQAYRELDENDGWEGDEGMVWEPAYNPHRNNKEVLNIQSQIEAINNEIAFLQVRLLSYCPSN